MRSPPPPAQPNSFVRKVWKTLGLGPSVLLLTLASIVVSVLVTAGIQYLQDGTVSLVGTIISIIVPTIVAPPFTYVILRLVAELDAAQQRMAYLAVHDDLTGAFNRRHFIDVAEGELARTRRYRIPFSIVLFDLDNFKKVNDTYGHSAGDQVLRAIAQVCDEAKREVDTFARYGGEEFVFVLPSTDQDRATAFAQRVLKLIAETSSGPEDSTIRVTASLGVATCSTGDCSLDQLLSRADQAVYLAKSQGKNQVISAETEVLHY